MASHQSPWLQCECNYDKRNPVKQNSSSVSSSMYPVSRKSHHHSYSEPRKLRNFSHTRLDLEMTYSKKISLEKRKEDASFGMHKNPSNSIIGQLVVIPMLDCHTLQHSISLLFCWAFLKDALVHLLPWRKIKSSDVVIQSHHKVL